LRPGEVIPEEYKDVNYQRAMEKEIEAFEKLGTFKWTEPRDDLTMVGSKWVYDSKVNDEKQRSFKARLVAQGFKQEKGVDYNETYAHVANQTSVRIFLTMAAIRDLELFQLDIKAAFLNAKLEEPIQMMPPPGFRRPGLVWTLEKAVYGLKQSSRQWEKKIGRASCRERERNKQPDGARRRM